MVLTNVYERKYTEASYYVAARRGDAHRGIPAMRGKQRHQFHHSSFAIERLEEVVTCPVLLSPYLSF